MKKNIIQMILEIIVPILLVLMMLLPASLSAQISVAVDNSSTYTPTQIVNGDFSTRPWMSYSIDGVRYDSYASAPENYGKTILQSYPNGVGGGWNTTETQLYHNSLFEYMTSTTDYNPNITNDGGFVEMNAFNSAVLYQDLATHGKDVIRWSLQHAVRTNYGADDQSMRVEVGSPEYSDANIVPASGINNDVNSHITSASKGTYTYSGSTGDYARGGQNLNALALNKNTNQGAWHTVTGIYVVPEGQTVTRFAFIATSATVPDGGNLLDNLTFSTLIGNLSATANQDGSVSLKGYWGETNASKSLVVVIGSTPQNVDMTSVTGRNFVVTIPSSVIGSATQVQVYHQDYADAGCLVEWQPMATITAAPTAIQELKYTGSAQTLVNAGTASGGTMYYSLDGSSWSTSLPSGTNWGTYTVYYKVVGDANHADNPGGVITAIIGKAASNGLTVGPWTFDDVRTGWTGYSGAGTSFYFNGLNNTKWSGSTYRYNDTDGCGYAYLGNNTVNSKYAIFSTYKHTETVPAYTRKVLTWSYKLASWSSWLVQTSALYAADNLDYLKNLPVDFTERYTNGSGSFYHLAHLIQNEAWGTATSELTGWFGFDNRSGSTSADKTSALLLTQVIGDGYNASLFVHQWGGFKHVSSSWTTYCYKHITFNPNGGEGNMAVQEIENSGTLTANAFTRAGYTFAGWATSENGDVIYANGAEITATSDDKGLVTLYARWTENPTHSIIYVDGTNWTTSPSSTPREGETVTLTYSGPHKVKSVTVAPKRICTLAEVTSEHVGKVIGTNGYVYGNMAAAEADGTTASAIIAYVGTAGSVEASSSSYRGLAISLANVATNVAWCTDPSSWFAGSTLSEALNSINGWERTYSFGNPTSRNITDEYKHHHVHAAAAAAYDYSVSRPAGTSPWFVPTLGQWNLAVQGLTGSTNNISETQNPEYSYYNLKTKFDAAGVNPLTWCVYWSSTEKDGTNMWTFCIEGNGSEALAVSKSLNAAEHVRAFFAF